MSIIGIHQLSGVGLGNGGDQIRSLDGALHDIDGVVHIQHAPVLPGQTQHIVKEVGGCPALILHIVDGVHHSGLGEQRIVLGLQEHRHKSGLPVVALDHIGDEVHGHQRIQTGLGEVGKALAVIVVAVDGTVTATEVIEVIHKVDLHAVGAVLQGEDARVLLTPAQRDMELGYLLHLILGVFQDLLVVGQNQNNFVAGDTGQSGGQCFHDVAQTTGLGVGRAFRSKNGNFHTISPFFTIMGLDSVPIRMEPGRTTTSLSRMTFFRVAFSPMTVSFITRQFSSLAPSRMET